jgi:hypothetical protein
LGRGMSQGRQEARLAEACVAQRFSGGAAQVGGGNDLLLLRPKQTDELGDCQLFVRQRLDVSLGGHDPLYGEAIGSWLGLFRQILVLQRHFY